MIHDRILRDNEGTVSKFQLKHPKACEADFEV